MKRCLLFLLMLITTICYCPVHSQLSSKPVYVIVHGAWGGNPQWSVPEALVDML